MVVLNLTDYSSERNVIVSNVQAKITKGHFMNLYLELFKSSRLNIDDLDSVLASIERRVRHIEVIHAMFFNQTFEHTIIVNNTLISTKKIGIEQRSSFGRTKQSLEFEDALSYTETINTQFQAYIITLSSLFETIVKLIELLIRKIILHSNKKPPASTPLHLLIEMWDQLVELDYKQDDIFYQWLDVHRGFLLKYLNQINSLRNRYVHGYTLNLEINNDYYVVKNFDPASFQLFSGMTYNPELLVDTFVTDTLEETKKLIGELFLVLSQELKHPTQQIPF